MGFNKKINNKSMEDIKESLKLKCVLSEVVNDFYSSNESEKKALLRKLDDVVSEGFNVKTANFVYKDNEHVLDTDNIYFGKLSSIKSPIDLFSRYLFEKRQQYQRICVKNNDAGSFDEKEFLYIKKSFEKAPVSGKFMNIPYSYGIQNYFLNPNKLDAFLFMVDELNVVATVLTGLNLYNDVSIKNINKMIKSLEKNSDAIDKFVNEMNVMAEEGVYSRRYEVYEYYVNSIKKSEIDQLSAILSNLKGYEPELFICFHENVWWLLKEEDKKRVVNAANHVISSFCNLDYDKEIKFDKGMNSYHFVRNKEIHVGDLKEVSARQVLCSLIWDYSYESLYTKALKMNEKGKDSLLKEYLECKKIIHDSKGDYSKISSYSFPNLANKMSVKHQKFLYFYINNGLLINGYVVKQPLSKEEYVIDMFKKGKRR